MRYKQVIHNEPLYKKMERQFVEEIEEARELEQELKLKEHKMNR